ncbi:hypothetical protein AB0K18_20235 [Nonomuraea sp. NPDC049421]|uniref:hypothetical protein n=1 Tax=Nonomuraea sp. NPDC049421 TaxID=3155275 RepID=UPI00342B1599
MAARAVQGEAAVQDCLVQHALPGDDRAAAGGLAEPPQVDAQMHGQHLLGVERQGAAALGDPVGAVDLLDRHRTAPPAPPRAQQVHRLPRRRDAPLLRVRLQEPAPDQPADPDLAGR